MIRPPENEQETRRFYQELCLEVNKVPAPVSTHYISAATADHGAVSDGNSLRDILVGIGTTQKATVVFIHDGVGTTTTYTVGTTFDASSYTNVSFVIDNGAVLTLGTGITLTLPSPGHITALENQHIFSGGTISFGSSGTVYPEWWGAIADDSTDCTDAIQAAIDSLADPGPGGPVIFSHGTYKITDTILWENGVALYGVFSAYSVPQRYPEISWYGDAAGTMIEVPVISDSLHNKTLRRLYLREGSSAVNHPDTAILFHDRGDLGLVLEDFQISGMDGNAIIFEDGGINVHLRKFRFDGILDHAIHWTVTGQDSLSLDAFTFDNDRSGETTSGGLVHFDMSSSPNNSKLFTSFSNAKIEANINLVAGDAFVKYEVNPDNTTKDQVFGTFTNVWVAPAGGVTVYDLVRVTPAFDYVRLCLINTDGTISGIPTWDNPLSTSIRHSFTVINPHGLSIGNAPGTEQSISNFVGDASVNNLYQFGEKSLKILYKAHDSSDWDDNPATVYPGQWFFDPTYLNTDVRYVNEVITAGTLGTLAGVTGTATNATALITCNDVSDLRIGQYITIGTDNKYIVHINATTSVVTVHSNISGGGYTDEAISFTAPTFRKHQLMSKAASAPGSGTWEQGDVVFNSGAAASGTVGWVCTTAGTPGTWKAFGSIAA